MMLQKRLTALRRMKQDFSFDRVKKIGVLWDASFENDFQHLAALNRQLAEAGKSVEVMAWIPGKSVPDRLTGLSYMRFLRKSDLNWALLPVSDDARKFVEKRFDLLIDINPSSLFQLSTLAALSSAPMKVGPDITDRPEDTPYDLMIKSAQPFSIAHFLEQAMHYLAIIGSPETRA
ncbi:MAG: hypothetical protein MUE37_06105 [Bacteroidales bacterium]|nr:hypothetical protein [Bacteroidales bacterium]